MNEYIDFNNESIVESYIDSVYQEANEASKKLRKTTDEFLKDNYTDADLKKMTPKQRNRVKKFLKDSDYDPKTNTIATDIVDKSGKPVLVLNSQPKGLKISHVITPVVLSHPNL